MDVDRSQPQWLPPLAPEPVSRPPAPPPPRTGVRRLFGPLLVALGIGMDATHVARTFADA